VQHLVGTVKPLIAIISCKLPAHVQRVCEQYATWIPLALAAGFNVEVFDGDRLHAPDGYADGALKLQLVSRWALASGYTRILFSDNDTYIRVKRFQIATEDYAGLFCPLNHGGLTDAQKHHATFDYAAGGAWWNSERAVKLLSTAPLYGDWAGDRWVGQALGRGGVYLTRRNDFISIPGHHSPEEHSWTDADATAIGDAAVVMQLSRPCDILACHKTYEGEL
jgi:hypothetical protein